MLATRQNNNVTKKVDAEYRKQLDALAKRITTASANIDDLAKKHDKIKLKVRSNG